MNQPFFASKTNTGLTGLAAAGLGLATPFILEGDRQVLLWTLGFLAVIAVAMAAKNAVTDAASGGQTSGTYASDVTYMVATTKPAGSYDSGAVGFKPRFDGGYIRPWIAVFFAVIILASTLVLVPGCQAVDSAEQIVLSQAEVELMSARVAAAEAASAASAQTMSYAQAAADQLEVQLADARRALVSAASAEELAAAQVQVAALEAQQSAVSISLAEARTRADEAEAEVVRLKVAVAEALDGIAAARQQLAAAGGDAGTQLGGLLAAAGSALGLVGVGVARVRAVRAR